MTTVTKYTPLSSPLDELFEWFESGWPTLADWRRDGARAIKVEDHMDKEHYVLRAELPGIDPDKDVDVSISNGVLTMRAERREDTKDKSHSEFHYGSFLRRVSLPAGAQEGKVSATYKDGILEIVVPLAAPAETARKVPIARHKS